ncbi:hypothetical protein GCM10010313_29790 [Streptomyces violarus]|nr:hypothetical protein GCM10010313_29790 [Streptomyces violarus]
MTTGTLVRCGPGFFHAGAGWVRSPAERGASPTLGFARAGGPPPPTRAAPSGTHARGWGGPAAGYGGKGTCRGVSARSGWRVNTSQLVSHPIAPFRGRTPPDAAPTHPHRSR